MEEVWKDIKGYENKYQISNMGRVKSLRRINNLGRTIKEKARAFSKNKDGYLLVDLYSDGVGKHFQVHRLVLKTFVRDSLFNEQANHKNGVNGDNREENLEWCTAKENIRHAMNVLGKKIGALKGSNGGENHGRHRLINADIFEIRRLLIEANMTQKKISGLFGVDQSVISNIKSGKSWSHI